MRGALDDVWQRARALLSPHFAAQLDTLPRFAFAVPGALLLLLVGLKIAAFLFYFDEDKDGPAARRKAEGGRKGKAFGGAAYGKTYGPGSPGWGSAAAKHYQAKKDE